MKNYKQKSKEEKELELNAILDKLNQGVLQVFQSSNYKAWLDSFSKFYQYSFNNVILILLQRPDATLCNSFIRWKSLGRNVNKGAKGIEILCPVKYRYTVEEDVYENGCVVINSDGTIKKENKEKEGLRFKIGHTFDISDTDGAELPTLTRRLEDSPTILETVIEEIMKASDIPVAYDDTLHDAYGYYHLTEKRIGIQPNLGSLHTCKTIIHELAHSKLHSLEQKEKVSKNEREIEAESVSYVTLTHFGFDVSEYSFSYIASYCDGKSTKEWQDSLSRIERCSRELINFLTEYTSLEQI